MAEKVEKAFTTIPKENSWLREHNTFSAAYPTTE